MIKRLQKIRATELKLEEQCQADKDVDGWRLRQLMDEHKEQVTVLPHKTPPIAVSGIRSRGGTAEEGVPYGVKYVVLKGTNFRKKFQY